MIRIELLVPFIWGSDKKGMFHVKSFTVISDTAFTHSFFPLILALASKSASCITCNAPANCAVQNATSDL